MPKKIKLNDTLSVEEYKQEFLDDCYARNLATTTINNYCHNIQYFHDYLIANNIELTDVTSKTIKQYCLWLQQNTNKNTISINTVLRHVSTYMKYLNEQNYIEPIKVQYLKAVQQPKEIYSDSDIRKLLRKPKMDDCLYAEFRSWAIVNTLVSTGMRRTSLVNIKLEDVLWDKKVIRLTVTKNKKVHYVPLSNKLSSVLKQWLRFRVKRYGVDYLFTTQSGEQLKASSLTNNIYKYCKSRGVDCTSVHCFRHYFACKFMEQGGSIFQLSRILGHSSVAITQNYLKSLDDIKILDTVEIDILSLV